MRFYRIDDGGNTIIGQGGFLPEGAIEYLIGEEPQNVIDRIAEMVAKRDLKNKEITNAVPKQYLMDTDWYVIRFQETAVEIPAEISTLRAEARLAIID